MTFEEIEALSDYHGLTPLPEDFDAFWEERMAEADAVPLEWEVVQAHEVPSFDTCEYLDLWFVGMGGARIYAKYVRPTLPGPLPLVLQFHGYPGASRSFFEQSSFAGMGCALIAMDNPGQGGLSEDVGGFKGTTVAGHLVAGVDGEPKDLYYVRLYQDVRILCRIVRAMGEQGLFDLSRIYVNGASQGGGMGIACCALNNDLIAKACILYPFLSDYRKVYELGADEIAYEGIRYYARWFDPDGTREDEWFGKLAYVETNHFAHLVKCPVLFGTGLADTVCPPETQCAVYNDLSCEKQRLLYPGFGHEEIQEFKPELLINAVTLKYTIPVFKEVIPYLPKECIISDIASVKTDLKEFYESTGMRYVSTHPMFGPTFANLQQLSEENAIIISEGDYMGRIFFKDLYQKLGLNIYEYTFEEHDKTVAYSLSIPFVSTFVFAAVMKHQDAPGTTFKRHMRIAKGVLNEDDYLLQEILFNPYTHDQVSQIRTELKELLEIIDNKDANGMKGYLTKIRNNVKRDIEIKR